MPNVAGESNEGAGLRAYAASRAFLSSRPASINAARIAAISARSILTSGGRTTARGNLPSSTSQQ
jgi:hypothetical protein